MGFVFNAIEYETPSKAISNESVIDQLYEQSHALGEVALKQLEIWTRQGFESTGTDQRFQCTEDETAYQLCVNAAKRAIDNSGLAPAEIDLLLYTGVGRGFIEPASANVFIDLLGLENATGYDILDACASWIRALDMAYAYMQTGRYRHVMLINAEFSTRYSYRYKLDNAREFSHWFPGVTIGEATTACIISRTDETIDYKFSARTWGEQRNLCFAALDNFDDYMGCSMPQNMQVKPYEFVSFGMPLLHFGASKLIEQYKQLPEFQGDHDIMFGHSASDGMSKYVMDQCKLDHKKFTYMHHRYGNVVSASVPLAMAIAKHEGHLKPGDDVIIFVASAGVSTILCRFRYLQAANGQ